MIKQLRRFSTLAAVLLSVYWVALFIATHTPAPRQLRLLHTSDKVLHAAAYAGLAFLFAWYLRMIPVLWLRLLMVVLVLAVYGAIDEGLQPFVGRTMDLRDWIADLTGIGIGLLCFLAIRGLIRLAVANRSKNVGLSNQQAVEEMH